MVRPMMTFLRVLIYGVVFVRRNGERKFHNWKKNASFFYGNGHARSSLYRDIKKEEERVKEEG